jgi:hypothetical protein
MNILNRYFRLKLFRRPIVFDYLHLPISKWSGRRHLIDCTFWRLARISVSVCIKLHGENIDDIFLISGWALGSQFILI